MSDGSAAVLKRKELQIRYCLAGNVEEVGSGLSASVSIMLREQGAFFTRLNWVMEQFEKAMGARPFPGTLNIRVCDEDIPKIEAFLAAKDFHIIPKDSQYCTAFLKKIWVNGVPGAAVFPSQEVHIYGKEIIEVISSYPLKEMLHLSVGNRVTLTDSHEDATGEKK